jgi:hypothetical protein
MIKFTVVTIIILLFLDFDRVASFNSVIQTTLMPSSSYYRGNKIKNRRNLDGELAIQSSKLSDDENCSNNSKNRDDFGLFYDSYSFRKSAEEDVTSSNKENNNNQQQQQKQEQDLSPRNTPASILQRLFDEIPFIHLFTGPAGRKKLPPVQVDDTNVLFYDVFLIVNLSLSISFWVTHRLDFTFLPSAFSEGCLFSILWIASGLYHGVFLYSAVDGHYPPDDPSGKGGVKEAAALAFNTYINAINLRLIAALLGAWIQHRKVGMGDAMEELIPLEIACGLVLMTLWRALHSSYTPRI